MLQNVVLNVFKICLQNDGMGMRYQQSIPPHLLLQTGPNRLGQSSSRFSFLPSRFPESSTGNTMHNTLQRHPSQLTLLSNNQFSSSNNNQLLQENLNTELLNVNIDPFSSDDSSFNKRLVYSKCTYISGILKIRVKIS